MSPLFRPFLLIVALSVAIGVTGVARADGGEAGLVIEHGDGSPETYCVPFTGDGIRGDDLLGRAGVPVEQFSGLVCSLGTQPGEGCRAASSFESCTCKCQGSNCVYWAFFSQSYGQQWTYAAIGFAGQKAKDGDLQGWKWGKGGANSAPAPAPITFEQVCGHAPRGGSAPTLTPPPQQTATGSAANAPPATPTREPQATQPGPVGIEQLTVLPAGTAPVAPVIAPGQSAPVATGGEGGSATAIVAFAVVALALVAAIAGALFWRSRRGA